MLLTAESVEDLSEMMAADFRDDLGLSTAGRYVGVDHGGRVVLCAGPARMSGGLWRADVDEAATAGGKRLDAVSLSLVLIR